MIRVLQVLPRLRRGGSQAFVMNIYRRIDRRKVQFDFVIFTEDHDDYYDEIIELGGRVFHFEKFNGRNIFKIKKNWKIFLNEHPEYSIIHFNVYSTASLYIPIARKLNRKTIVHSHSTSNGKGLMSFIKNTLQLPLRRQADYLFACSSDAGKWLFGKKAINKSNYRFVPNGIEVNHFIFDINRRKKTREQLGLQNKIVIGHVGGFETPKNHPFIIEVFKDICEIDKDAILLLVGDGTFVKEIKNKVDGYHISDRVIFAGLHSDVAPLLDAMDVFFFPSLWEGFPVSLIEAQASGLKCVVSDTITKDAILSNGITYISLNEPKTVWINELLGKSLNESREMDSRLKSFDSSKVAKDLCAFYEGLLK